MLDLGVSLTSLAPRRAVAVTIPVNTVLPVVSGTETVGETLTTTDGTWTNEPSGYTYQWMQALLDGSGNVITDAAGRPLGVEISGETASTYVLQAADEDEHIFCEVTATNASGSASISSDAVGPIGAAASTATWNPADKSADITLTDGNLTATMAGSGAHRNARATGSSATGKKFFQVTTGASVSPDSRFVGLAVAGASLTAFLGSNANSLGWTSDTGVSLNGNIANVSGYGAGAVLSVAVDLDAKLLWLRADLNNWNNDAGADPATGTGGINISTLTAGAVFPACGFFTTGHEVTANFGATAYSFAAPTGFGNW